MKNARLLSFIVMGTMVMGQSVYAEECQGFCEPPPTEATANVDSPGIRAASYRGHNTHIAYAIAVYMFQTMGLNELVDKVDRLRWGPIVPQEREYFCALQRTPFVRLHTFMPFYTKFIGSLLRRSPGFVNRALQNHLLCK